MSDTSLNKIIQYGTTADRIAYTPNPAAGSQVLYIWYDTDNAPNTYIWNSSAWVQINTGGGGGTVLPFIANGRLTTESGVPVSSSNRTAQSTIYYTPFNGNHISLYTAAVWTDYTFTERSFALSGLTSGKNYDVFIYDNASVLTLVLSAAWTNDTTRADAITRQDGVWVLNSDKSKRLLGTIRTTGTTTTEDGPRFFVANAIKEAQVSRASSAVEATNSWTYSTNTWRQANANAANQFEFLVSIQGNTVEAQIISTVGLQGNTGAVAAGVAVGFDSTTTPFGIHNNGYNQSSDFLIGPCAAKYEVTCGIGYHFMAWLEFGIAGTLCLFYGDNGASDIQSGIFGRVIS